MPNPTVLPYHRWILNRLKTLVKEYLLAREQKRRDDISVLNDLTSEALAGFRYEPFINVPQKERAGLATEFITLRDSLPQEYVHVRNFFSAAIETLCHLPAEEKKPNPLDAVVERIFAEMIVAAKPLMIDDYHNHSVARKQAIERITAYLDVIMDMTAKGLCSPAARLQAFEADLRKYHYWSELRPAIAALNHRLLRPLVAETAASTAVAPPPTNGETSATAAS